jgi:hypothetical protein
MPKGFPKNRTESFLTSDSLIFNIPGSFSSDFGLVFFLLFMVREEPKAFSDCKTS